MAITKILAFLHLFRIEWLFFLVGAAIWGATYVVRRFVPALWVIATTKNPAVVLLPMAVVGALLVANPSSGKAVWDIVQDTLIKAVMGVLLAMGLHDAAKMLPGPYDGAEKQVAAAAAKRSPPSA